MRHKQDCDNFEVYWFARFLFLTSNVNWHKHVMQFEKGQKKKNTSPVTHDHSKIDVRYQKWQKPSMRWWWASQIGGEDLALCAAQHNTRRGNDNPLTYTQHKHTDTDTTQHKISLVVQTGCCVPFDCILRYLPLPSPTVVRWCVSQIWPWTQF